MLCALQVPRECICVLCQCLPSNQGALKLQPDMLVANYLFTALSEHRSLLLNCTALCLQGAMILQVFCCRKKERKSHLSLLQHLDNAEICLIWVRCCVARGNCFVPAGTERGAVMCCSRQCCAEHPVLCFLSSKDLEGVLSHGCKSP